MEDTTKFWGAIATVLGVGLTAWTLTSRKPASLNVKNWEENHVYLFLLPQSRNKQAVHPSPFCAKVLLWLRMNQIPHTVDWQAKSGNPTSKWPFIELNGEVIGDSTEIIAKLETSFGKRLEGEAKLGKEEKGRAVAIQRLVEEHLYFLLLVERWQEQSGFDQLKEEFFSPVPQPVRFFVTRLVRSKVVSSLHGQGAGRLSASIRHAQVSQDLTALSAMLGTKSFFFGDAISNVDLIVFSMLDGILFAGVDTPISLQLAQHQNLVEYVNRLRSTLPIHPPTKK